MGVKKEARLSRVHFDNIIQNIKVHDDVEKILNGITLNNHEAMLTFVDDKPDEGQNRKSMEFAQLLIDSTADVNHKSHAGITPLMIAAVNGRVELCQKLVDAKADVNIHDGHDKQLYWHFQSNARLSKEEHNAMQEWIHQITGVGEVPRDQQSAANKWKGVGALLRFNAPSMAKLAAAKASAAAAKAAALKAPAKGKKKRKSTASESEETSEDTRGLVQTDDYGEQFVKVGPQSRPQSYGAGRKVSQGTHASHII